MRQILFLVRKEFRQLFRTREMLALLFIAPLMMSLILGFAVTNEVKHLKLVIVDLDDTKTSRDLLQRFGHNDRFDVVGYGSNPQEINDDIFRWKAQVGVIVPQGFEADWRAGRHPQVDLVLDAIDGNAAGVALGYAGQILSAFSATAVPVGTQNPYQLEDRLWYNPDLANAQYMIPGLVVIIITLISMMLSSMALVKEKEIGTLEQLLVTPITKWQLLIGKLLPYLLLTFVELEVVITFANLIFGVHMVGSYDLLAALALVYLFTTLGMGILISSLTQTQQQAMFFSWFFMVFMILLSGLFIPIDNMPWAIKQVTFLNPMRFFVAVVRDIFQKGSTLPNLARDVVPMALFGMVIFTLAVLSFRKKTN